MDRKGNAWKNGSRVVARGRHRGKRYPASGRRTSWTRRGWRRVGEDGFISYRLKGNQSGRKRVSVAMATAREPAPCDLNVYLNARELRDVIFTPVFSSLFLPFSFVEDALGDNVILSAPCTTTLPLCSSTIFHRRVCFALLCSALSLSLSPSLSLSTVLARRSRRQRFLRQTALVHWPVARN